MKILLRRIGLGVTAEFVSVVNKQYVTRAKKSKICDDCKDPRVFGYKGKESKRFNEIPVV